MKNQAMETTQEYLAELLDYSPVTGTLRWKDGPEVPRGDGGEEQKVKISEKYTWYAKRVIWCLMTGDWPTRAVRHINGDKTDNRWCNLSA